MIKYVCDICRKNEASEHLKVKKLPPTLTECGIFEKWQRIGVCRECYNKLIKGLEEKS